MKTAASVFRQNLMTLAKSRGITNADDLSAALGFTGNERGWLLRIWEKGISRPDPRRAASLKAVANFLKVQRKDLWQPNTGSDTAAEKSWERAFFGDNVSHTRDVIRAYQTLQQTRQQRPFIYKKALEQYGQMEEAMIADWVGGAIRGDGPDDDVIFSCFDPSPKTISIDADEKFRSLRNVELFDFLQDHFDSNASWTCFVKRMEEFLVARSNASSCDGSLQWLVVQSIETMINKLMNEPPSMRMILDRFEASFATGPSESVLGLTVILADLKLNPGWVDWVENEHFGSEVEACQRVHEMWEAVTEQFGGKVDIEAFVKYYCKMIDDAQSDIL